MRPRVDRRLSPPSLGSALPRRDVALHTHPQAALRLAGVEGLEPPTPGFGDRCSSQLSYTPSRWPAAHTACGLHDRANIRTSRCSVTPRLDVLLDDLCDDAGADG